MDFFDYLLREFDYSEREEKEEMNFTRKERESCFPYMPVELHFTTKVTPKSIIEEIDRVEYNNPATIVFWKNGEKTVVKCHEEKFDAEKGLAMAICKYLMGNDRKYYDVFKVFDEGREERIRQGKLKELQKEVDYLNRKMAELEKKGW